MPGERPLHIVSVSIGSKARDKTVHATLGGREFLIERRGTDGDLRAARELIAQLDGRVDAFGMGGADLYLFAAGRRYTIRDAAWIAAAAVKTPLLDGSGLKASLEPAAVEFIDSQALLDLRATRVLVVTAVDRFGMAEALAARASEIVFGDLMFNLGLPVPVRGLRALQITARLLLPVVAQLPFRWLYPIGEQQKRITPRWGQWFAWADLIAGDWHMIHRFLPPEPTALAGKTVLTNTTTLDDVRLLAERGLPRLITTTPQFDGRTFGTNVLEAVLTAYRGSRTPLPPAELLTLCREWGWAPTVIEPQTTL